MTQRRLSRRWLVPLCLALLLAGLRPTPPAAVSAATVLHVTDCGDAGANTLRGQLAAAGAGDTIVFDQDCTITLATGTLTLAQDVTIDGSGHTVIVDGGCTAACGTWTAVGGVTVFTVPSGVTAKLNTLTIQHGNTAVNGGGIANSGTLAVTNSTFSGNTADRGGGINNTGTLAVTNSTFSGNDAGGGGGGIANDIVNFVPSTLVVTNSTISGNSAYSGGGGIYNAYVFNGSTLIRDQATVTNTIVAGNTAAATYPDLGATHLNRITSGGHNLFGSVQEDQITLGGGDLVNPTPLLDTLGNNGGPTQTMRLLPGSPAIANGDPTVCANPAGTAPVGGKDQRGAPRPPSLCAIGAFEPLLITISPSSGPITGGTPVTLTGAGFLAGVTVSLGGASCTNVQVATDTTLTCLTGAHAAGVVDVALTIGSVTHTLSHGYFYGDTTLHVTDCGDAGPNTLRGQIAAEARTIVFDQDCTITLTTGTLTLAQNVAIDGSGHTVIVNGGLELAPGVTVFSVPSGVTANLNALTIQNVNTAADGGGIANGGTLAVTNSTIRNNSAATGGGIDNTGTLTVTNSTISGNESHYLGGSSGGGINNALGGTATVTNSTISGNSVNSVSGSNGGGIANNSNSTLTLTNSIVAGNSAYANSNVFANGPDIAFAITSGGHNLFGSTSGATFSLGSGDLVNPTPLLGALANNGGPTQTIALLPGSPALDAGGDATCQATGPGQVNGLDQRGSSRTSGAGAHCDIGAFEAYTAPATIALDAASLSQTYDGTPRLVTATTAPAGLAYAVTYGGSPTPPTAAGSYPVVATITAPGESASIAGTLVVAPASQALAFTSTAPTGAVYGGTYTVAATGGASGNPVTFSSLTPEFCTVAGSTVRFTGVGTCTIAANQAGNANHNAASQVTQSVAIAKKALTVTAGDAHRPFAAPPSPARSPSPASPTPTPPPRSAARRPAPPPPPRAARSARLIRSPPRLAASPRRTTPSARSWPAR